MQSGPNSTPQKWVNKDGSKTEHAEHYANINPERAKELKAAEFAKVIARTHENQDELESDVADFIAENMDGAPQNPNEVNLGLTEVKAGEESNGIFAFLEERIPGLFKSGKNKQIAYKFIGPATDFKVNDLRAGDLVEVNAGVLKVTRNGETFYEEEIYPWDFILKSRVDVPTPTPSPSSSKPAGSANDIFDDDEDLFADAENRILEQDRLAQKKASEEWIRSEHEKEIYLD